MSARVLFFPHSSRIEVTDTQTNRVVWTASGRMARPPLYAAVERDYKYAGALPSRQPSYGAVSNPSVFEFLGPNSASSFFPGQDAIHLTNSAQLVQSNEGGILEVNAGVGAFVQLCRLLGNTPGRSVLRVVIPNPFQAPAGQPSFQQAGLI